MSKGLSYILEDLKENLFSSKFYAFVIVQLLVTNLFISSLKEFSIISKSYTTPYVAPFLFSDIYFNIFFIAMVIYCYSNVPFMQYRQMYQIIRMGKKKWFFFKIIYIIITSYVLVFIEIILSIIVLLPRIAIEFDWGKVLYTLSITNAAEQYNVSLIIPYEIISKYSPLKAMIIQFFITGLVVTFIGIIMFAISIIFSRLTAICAAMIFEILPIIVLNSSGLINNSINKLIYISPVSWIDMKMIGNRSKCGMPQISYIITFISVAVIILSILSGFIIKKVDLQWNREE